MKRLSIIIRAIWSKVLGRAEDKHHREILDFGYEKLQDMLLTVKQDVANVATSKHRIMQLVAKTEGEANGLEQSAAQFLAAGDEGKAREALQRKALALQQLTRLQADLDGVAAKQTDLEASQRELETRIHEFATEKEVIKARYSAADAQARIAETVTGISGEAMELGKTVGRFREKTEMLEARAGGIQELVNNGSLDDMFNPGQSPLDRESAALARSTQVDADLERLKRQLGPGEPSQAEAEAPAT